MSDATRIHGLDAFRAVLMLLGIFIHAALNYLPEWFVQDPHNQAEWLYIIVDGIHTFRMPAFFVLSGFFAALLVDRRGVFLMVRNRFDRIVLPLVVFVFLNTWFYSLFAKHNSYINQGMSDPLQLAFFDLTLDEFIPWETGHLWFLHQLFLITIVFAVAAKYFKSGRRAIPLKMRSAFVSSVENPWLCLVVYSLLGSIWFALLEWSDIPTDTSWFPSPIILLYYTMFYAAGWNLYTAKVDLSVFKQYCWPMLFLAVIGYLCRLGAGLYLDGVDPSCIV